MLFRWFGLIRPSQTAKGEIRPDLTFAPIGADGYADREATRAVPYSVSKLHLWTAVVVEAATHQEVKARRG